MVSNKPKIDDVNKCSNCQACVDACPKNCLKLNDTNNYILTIELIGQLPIEAIVKLLDRYTKEYMMLLKRKLSNVKRTKLSAGVPERSKGLDLRSSA